MERECRGREFVGQNVVLFERDIYFPGEEWLEKKTLPEDEIRTWGMFKARLYTVNGESPRPSFRPTRERDGEKPAAHF